MWTDLPHTRRPRKHNSNDSAAPKSSSTPPHYRYAKIVQELPDPSPFIFQETDRLLRHMQQVHRRGQVIEGISRKNGTHLGEVEEV